MIAAEGATVRAGHRLLLDRVSLDLSPGEVLAVVGPNGAGKSTLLRLLTGERRPDAGSVTMEGRSLSSWHPAALARRRAVVSQHVALSFPMTAGAVVALGRLPWHATPDAARDRAAVAAALAAAGIAHLAGRSHATLSGGERQRVHLARALAQLDGAARPAALLLDEPTASLDVRHAAGLLHELRRLAAQGLAVMVVLHDLNEAAFVADRVAILAHGRCVAQGPKAAVLRPGLLAEVYGVPFRQTDGALLPAYGLPTLG
jgi:iron complex transport system ATP-binding protein